MDDSIVLNPLPSDSSSFLDGFAAPALSPDASWMDLVDQLIEAPLVLNEPTMISPIPTRAYSFLHDELKEEQHYFGSSIKRPKSAVDVPSSSSSFDFGAPGSSSSSSFIPSVDEAFLGQQSHVLHRAPSLPHSMDAASYEFMSPTSTVTIARTTPPLPVSPSLSPSPSPSAALKKTATVPRSKSFTQKTANKLEPSASSSLTSPMQALLDQDPSMLLQGTKAPHVTTGLQLVHMLLACAEAFAQDDYNQAKTMLLQLHQRVSPGGDSIHRVAAYFTDALHSRLAGTGHISYHALRAYDAASLEEILAAYHILYQVCPYIKFAHFTCNQAIFEAFEGEEKVHIIDLEILQGYQWPAFMQALAARPEGTPHLRITGVGMPLEAVQETGKRLADLAESLHVPFQYHAVGQRLENLEASMLQRRAGEALAVNSINRLHRLFYSSEQQLPPLIRLLHMIREQEPTVVTLVEQEASHNVSSFLGRFLEALQCYSAIFDSLEATLPQSSPERSKVEQVVFASEITNIVACEGQERIIRHEKVEKWQKIMESAGFQNVPLSQSAIHQSHLLLGLYPCEGYTLCEERCGLLLGWQDRPVIGASVWRC